MGNNLADLHKALDQKGTQPVYLVQGSERLMVDKAVNKLLDAAIGEAHDSMAITRLDLAESGCDSRVILGHCQSLGLFTTQTAIVLRAAELLDKKSNDRDALGEYVQNPNTNAVLILIADKLKASTKLVKSLKKSGCVFTFDRLKSREVPSWIEGEARRLKHTINIDAAHLVADLVGNDLLQLTLVVDLLSLYVGPEKVIDIAAVEKCLCATRNHSVFELVDSVGEGQRAAALDHLHSMLAHREPPLRILAMLIRHFRLLWQVSAHKEAGGSLDGATRELKLHPFQAKKFWRQTQRFKVNQLKRSYERLFEADKQLKSSLYEHSVVMERLVMGLCVGNR
jgi:DNA polymerase-3 subunit delta